MQDIKQLIKLEDGQEAKLEKKRLELEGNLAKEVENAKAAVEKTKAAIEGEEKKAAQKGQADGVTAAKQVKQDYKKKMSAIKAAYTKNKKSAVDKAIKAVIQG
ncbi:hypothetical protein ACFLQ2_01580 [archaeon]